MPQSACKTHMNFKKDFQKKGHFKSGCKCCNDYLKHQEKVMYARGMTIGGLKLLNDTLVEQIQELEELLAGFNLDTDERIVIKTETRNKPKNLVFTEDLPLNWKMNTLALKCSNMTPNEDTSETASECIICKEKRSNQIILSCGHLTCHSCMVKIDNSNACAICRQTAEYGKMIYFA